MNIVPIQFTHMYSSENEMYDVQYVQQYVYMMYKWWYVTRTYASQLKTARARANDAPGMIDRSLKDAEPTLSIFSPFN